MRDPVVQAFLTACEVGLARCTGPAAEVAAEVIRRWQAPQPATGQASMLPVCDQIPEASTPLARAFAPLAPRLSWSRRGSAKLGEHWYDRHANAVILGPKGLEERSDLWVGVTVMAPGTTYPDHNHAPAEVYLPLTAGAWWNEAMDWTDPGLSGFIYNPPGITHAMRSGAEPFLALWFLPL